MATIILQYTQVKNVGKAAAPIQKDKVTTAVVGASPGRLHYATVDGKARCFERVGTAGGNEVYREQVGS
jgi:hypothetical protein